jgi:hypothetical protein
MGVARGRLRCGGCIVGRLDDELLRRGCGNVAGRRGLTGGPEDEGATDAEHGGSNRTPTSRATSSSDHPAHRVTPLHPPMSESRATIVPTRVIAWPERTGPAQIKELRRLAPRAQGAPR